MRKTKLRIGRIPYANLFPTFYYLEKECDLSEYKFIKGVPSALNKMLRDGELDISPSSSIEYLKNKKKYFILPWFTISSSGPINSILLFSKIPIEELGGKTIAVSSDSETSVSLLKIILNDFLSLNCRFKTFSSSGIRSVLTHFPAALLIGDNAMKEAKKAASDTELKVKSKTNRSQSSIVNRSPRAKPTGQSSLFIYDLGELWEKHTELPFVFALWIVRKDILPHKMELIKKLAADLLAAKKYTSKNFSSLAKLAPQSKWLGEKDLVKFWKGISYDFTERHMEGLRLFEKYAVKKHKSG